MKINHILLLSLFVLFLASCNNTPGFVGSWELNQLQLGDETITGNDIGNPSYTFNEDKTFSIEIDDLKQTGTWDLNGKELTLINDEDSSSENVLVIVEINDSIFHYTAGVGDETSNVYLMKK